MVIPNKEPATIPPTIAVPTNPVSNSSCGLSFVNK